ncbi:preprotein translocase subunit YajC [Roseimaritima sediminicola]|uniref:preprotein translocase subunit YajC n=1 Tax=Roseimaritima sediminicola TaxID=2662066 RepID=UPI0013874FDE|nr:preprotein translocase subunit YajC [Roseimaritima sediminicola]
MNSLPPFAESLFLRTCELACLLAQDAGAAGDAAPEMSPVQRILNSPFLLGGGLLALFYIMVLLPEKRKKQQAAEKLSQLKKNQRVITIGGIHGVIVSAPADSDVVTIRTDESGSNRLKVNRSAIATVLSDDKAEAKKEKEADSK